MNQWDYLDWMIGKTIAITRGPREGQQAIIKGTQGHRTEWLADCIGEHGARFCVSPMDFAFAKETT